MSQQTPLQTKGSSEEVITISEEDAKQWSDAFTVERSATAVKPRSKLHFVPYTSLVLLFVVVPLGMMSSFTMYLNQGSLQLKSGFVRHNLKPFVNSHLKPLFKYYAHLRRSVVSTVPSLFDGVSFTAENVLLESGFADNDNEVVGFALVSFSLAYLSLVAVMSKVIGSMKEKHQPVYLVDFVTLRCDDDWIDKTGTWFVDKINALKGKVFDQDSVALMEKVAARGCISSKTYYPKYCLSQKLDEIPPSYNNIEKAREEAEYVFTYVVGELLKNTGTKPQDIDILVVNCSIFCPTPSLAALIIKKFGMKETTIAYNLGGMGCSAGVIAIDLAKDLLRTRKNQRALVVSTENITQCWYLGNDRSFLIQNTLFRVGGAAILLSNIPQEKLKSKYEFVDCVRIHRGRDETSYGAINLTMDSNGTMGVKLTKEVISSATKAVTKNLTLLLTRNFNLIPLSELIKFVLPKLTGQKPYVPNFSKIFDHFCIHAGGRKVLDDIGNELKLGDKLIPSRAALYRFGNTSSASPWYELEYIENTKSIKSGQTVLQLAFGSGFKCNTAIWKRL